MKTYERYKDSGIEWIGGIPEHWEVSRLKFVGESIIGLTYSPEEVTEDESGYLVLRSSNIQSGKLSLDDNVFVKKHINEKLITRKNDILICARNGSVDLVGKNILIDERTAGQTFGAFMTVFRGRSNQFVYWFFNSPFFDAQKGAFSTSTINQLTSNILNNLITTIPPISEQTAIANYLDVKTIEIDRVVADKEALINLYEEEKKALINEAVTKGLNANVKLKPSSVDWLSDIPEHWEVKRLKYLAEIKTGEKNTEDNEEDGQYPFFVRSQTIERISTFSFDGEAILTAGDGVGVAKVFHYINGKFDYHQRVYRISHFKEIIGKFLFHYLENNLYKEVLKINAKSTVDSLRLPMFQNFMVAIPPLEEQTAIVHHIETETTKINDKINQIKQEIELLKEYRQALIFEAVTGKIRVH